MSKLRKIRESIGALAKEFEQHRDDGEENDGETTYDGIKGRLKLMERIQGEMTEIETSLNGFLAKAKEVDPDVAIYGPKTRKKILDAAEDFKKLNDSLQMRLDALRTAFLPLEEKRKDELDAQARVKAAEEEARKAAESRKESEEKEALRIAEAQEAERVRREELEEEVRRREASERLRAKRERQAARRAREAKALRMSPGQALAVLCSELKDSKEKLATAVDALRLIVDKVMESPDESRWRRLRKSNPLLHRDVLQYYGGWAFLISCGFREKILQLTEQERLQRQIQWYYELYAPSELPESGGRANVAALAMHYSSGGRRPAELWKRLREKYNHTHEDVLRAMRKDKSGRLEAEGECYLVLAEPPVERRDAWTAWYERLKTADLALANTPGPSG